MIAIEDIPEQVKERVRGCQWVHEDLRVWTRTFGEADKETGEKTVATRGLSRRKAQWPEAGTAEAAVTFLSSKACLDYLVLCREELGDGDWEPVWAWFEQADSTQKNPRGGWIHQILRRRDAEAGEDGPYVLEDGCKQKVTATFYWDVPDVPECPNSTSGVQYAVSVRGRDEDSGLYTCVVTRTETVRQDVEAYKAHEELGETRVRADALGLREDHEAEGGSTVDEKVEAYAEEQGLKLDDGKVEDTTAPGGKGVGVVVDLQKQKNADCTTDVVIQNTREEESLRHVLEGRETVRGKQLTKTDIHVWPEAGEDGATYPLVAQADGKLTTKRVEKTPGGVRNVTTTTLESKEVEAGDGTEACERTVYEHTHTQVAENTEKVEEASAGPTGADGTKTGLGYHERVASTLNDDGTFNVEKRGVTELEVEEAGTATAGAYIESQEVATGNNLTAATAGADAWDPDDAVTPASGTSTDGVTSGGTTRQPLYRRETQTTPGGVKNVTVRKTTPHPASVVLNFKADQNGRHQRYGWFRNFTKSEAEAFVANYTGGSVQRNAFGLFDGTVGGTFDANGNSGSSIANFTEWELPFAKYNYSTEYIEPKEGDTSGVGKVRVFIVKASGVKGLKHGDEEEVTAYVNGKNPKGATRIVMRHSDSGGDLGWYYYEVVTAVAYQLIEKDASPNSSGDITATI